MALSIKRLVPGSILTGSAAPYYTCPASKYAILKSVTLANTTAGAVSASLHLVPSGDSASAANMIRTMMHNTMPKTTLSKLNQIPHLQLT
jgi:hypothetical protein